MKIAATIICFTALAGVLLADDQSQNIAITVTEEVYDHGVLSNARVEVFHPGLNVTDPQVHLVSTNGVAFLNLTKLRIEGTNIWFQKWEYGRNPTQNSNDTPLYMILSGSVSQQCPGEFHLIVRDNAVLRLWNKSLRGTTDTCVVIKATTD
jgi:hypothetical protein